VATIARQFWPESGDGQALTNLRCELHDLRRILGEDDSLDWMMTGWTPEHQVRRLTRRPPRNHDKCCGNQQPLSPAHVRPQLPGCRRDAAPLSVVRGKDTIGVGMIV
jgi:hypothetical protein